MTDLEKIDKQININHIRYGYNQAINDMILLTTRNSEIRLMVNILKKTFNVYKLYNELNKKK